MTINTKRLKTDAAYWDEVAPEDAQEFGSSNRYFYKQENGVWFYWREDIRQDWTECSMGQPLDENRIPRPQAPKAEWADGLPPVGCECEMRSTGCPEWLPVTIKYISEHGVVAETGHGVEAFVSCTKHPEFRPLRTADQRQREELSEVVAHASVLKGGTILEEWQYDCIADAVMNFYKERYNLEPKP